MNNPRLKSIILEIGEATARPYSYKTQIGKLTKLTNTAKTQELTATFDLEDETKMRIQTRLNIISLQDDPNNIRVSLNVSYDSITDSVEGYSYHLTSKGLKELFRIMATVVKFTKESIKFVNNEYDFNVNLLTFSVADEGRLGKDKSEKYENQRRKLYRYYLTKYLPTKGDVEIAGIKDFYGVTNVRLRPQLTNSSSLTKAKTE